MGDEQAMISRGKRVPISVQRRVNSVLNLPDDFF